MSPILVRPVREQLEHDRVIRLLQAKYKRKFEVGMNPGAEQAAPVGAGSAAVYPDLVLISPERGRKLLGVVEVETGESVNNLEAMSQWANFARLRAPLHLYVPAGSIDTARRLCADLQIPVAEIWTYHPVGDQMRFTLVQRSTVAPHPEPKVSHPGEPARTALREPARPAAVREAVRPVTREAGRAAVTTRPTRAASLAPSRRKPAGREPGRTAAKPRAAQGTATRSRTAKAAPPRARAKKTASAKTARTQKRK